jgi:hypothetical protein
MNKTEVRNFRHFSKGTLCGFFDVYHHPFIIKSLTLHRKNGSSWIGFPAVYKLDSDGRPLRGEDDKLEWQNCVAIPDKETFERFKAWCLKEVEKLEAERG